MGTNFVATIAPSSSCSHGIHVVHAVPHDSRALVMPLSMLPYLQLGLLPHRVTICHQTCEAIIITVCYHLHSLSSGLTKMWKMSE